MHPQCPRPYKSCRDSGCPLFIGLNQLTAGIRTKTLHKFLRKCGHSRFKLRGGMSPLMNEPVADGGTSSAQRAACLPASHSPPNPPTSFTESSGIPRYSSFSARSMLPHVIILFDEVLINPVPCHLISLSSQYDLSIS